MGRDAGQFSGDEGGVEKFGRVSGDEGGGGMPERESARGGPNGDPAGERPGARRTPEASGSERILAVRHRVPLGILLFAALGGAIAWSGHLLVSYFLVALGCNLGWGDGLFRAVLGATTVVFAGVAAAAAVVAYRRWRGLQNAHSDEAGQSRKHGHDLGGSPGSLALDEGLSRDGSRAAFILLMGLILDAFFCATIVLAGLPPFFVPACAEVFGG